LTKTNRALHSAVWLHGGIW